MYVSSSRVEITLLGVRKTLFLILVKLFLVLCSKLVACGKDLSPVVYRADQAIRWISHYLAEVFENVKQSRHIAIYSVDNVIQPSNNQGLYTIY